MNKPSSKEVGPAYTGATGRRDWSRGRCAWSFSWGEEEHSEVKFYLAAYHDGYSLPLCKKDAAVRRQNIREEKRRVKKRLAAFRVGRMPRRTERHPDWEDDERWS